MKKYLLLLMALSLILSNMAPIRVYAESELDKQLEKIVLKVKELMDISEEYDTLTLELILMIRISPLFELVRFKRKLPSISIAEIQRVISNPIIDIIPIMKSQRKVT